MKVILKSTLLAIGLSSLSACVVAPPHVAVQGTVAVPAGVVYAGPTYAMPAPGYVWSHHRSHGWGWRHPANGWHRGWR